MMIRELLPSDRIEFLELCNIFGETCIDKARFKIIMDKRKESGITTFVGVAIDKIVSTHAVIIEPKFLHDGSNVAHFEDLIVHPDYREHGIGEQMLSNSLQYANDMNCYKAIYKCSEKMIPYYTRTLNGYQHEISMRTDF